MSHRSHSSSSSSSSTDDNQANYTNIPSDVLNTGYNGMNYVFVKNNPNNSTWSLIASHALEKLSDMLGDHRIKYGIVSVETGRTGTLHLQGYFQLNKKKKFSALKQALKEAKLWCAPARASPQQNIDYISHTGPHEGKAGDLVEGPFFLGASPTNSGSRTDIDGLVDALKSGKSMVSIAQSHTHTLLKYMGNAIKVKAVLDSAKVRSWMTELYIYTGVAGSGKSHAAYNEAIQYLADNDIDQTPYMLMVPRKGEQLWWEEYDGQAVVIIDDFYGSIDLDYFKRLIDKYPCRVNVKNRSAEFLARRVYITSNQSWRSWWGTDLLNNNQNEAAISRRITVDKHFDRVYRATTDSNTASEARTHTRTLAPIIVDDTTSAPVRRNANVGLSWEFPSVADHSDIYRQVPEWGSGRNRPAVLSQNDLDFLSDEFGNLDNDDVTNGGQFAGKDLIDVDE